MLNWIATAATFICAMGLLFWGLALILSRPLPALYEITRTLTFRWTLAICLVIMLVTLGPSYGGPVPF